MTFSAVVTSHGRQRGPSEILATLVGQTRPPDEVVVLFSAMGEGFIVGAALPFCLRVERAQPDLKDWGHAKRALGLVLVTGDWVGFFNDDDDYERTYVEKMMAEADPSTGLVYCYWRGGTCEPRGGSSTSGNFIVSRRVALLAGGWASRVYEADGVFIDAARSYCESNGLAVKCVPESLYRHNAR